MRTSSASVPGVFALFLAAACGSAGANGGRDGGATGGSGGATGGSGGATGGSGGATGGSGGATGGSGGATGGSGGATGGSGGATGGSGGATGGSGGATGGSGGATGGSGGATGGSGGSMDAGADAGCSPGTQETVACGKCGTKQRSCNASGQWDAFGACSGEQGVCEAGQQANVPCGNCQLGTRSDYCTTSCQWTAGPCTGVPATACTPGDVKAGPTACANAGEIHASTCQNDCSWSTASATCAAPPSGWRYMSPLKNFVFVGEQVRTAVWSGKEMLIWGRSNGGSSAVRAGYEPGTDTWRVLANDPIGQRTGEVGVWTGSRFFVWGGASIYSSQSQCNADGALYDPVSNTWEKVPGPSNQDPPKCRNWAVAAWAPETQEVLIWGGASTAGYLADGDAYKPSTKTWRVLPAAPIAAREQAEGFYSGGKLHVFGGVAPGYLADGASFDPVTNTWTKLPTTPVLGPRMRHVAKGNASGGAFWGGVGSKYHADGLAYDGTSASFVPIPAPGAGVVPNAPRAFAGGWFGQGKLWFWGGKGTKPGGEAWFDDGAAFDLATKTWTAIPAGGPSPRESPLVVWTGSEAIVFGGWVVGASGYDGRIYRP